MSLLGSLIGAKSKDAPPPPLAKSVDLDQWDARPAAEEGRWLRLKHPVTGEPLPARIRLLGSDSQVWKDTQLAQRRARLELLESTGAMRVDPAVADEEDLARLIAVTAEFDGMTRGAEPFPCTPANAREFYLGWPDFRAQAVAFIVVRANFFPRSASGS